ncbi:MAG: hypothetical protein LBT99_02340, partial [Bifidobacteriaceae bacterium]|nr:hypothetical protein [Bifidobacteriaceae bacterium]
MFKKISKKKIASISSLILSIIIVIISSVIFWFTPVNKKITTSTDITNNSSYIIFNPGVLQAVSSNSLINITTNSSDTLQIAYGNYKDANGFLADDTNYTTITGFSSINSWQTQNILPTKTVLSDNLDISQSDMFDLIATSNGQISFDLNSLGSFNNDSTLIITRKGSLTPIQLAIDWTNNSTDTISHFGFILGLILLLGSVIGFVISPNKSKHTKSIEKKPLVHHISHKVKKLNQTGIVEYDISKINQIDNKNIKTKTRFNVNKDIKRVKE